MRLTAISTLSFLSLVLPFGASGASHGEPGRRHDSIARRARGDIHLYKREKFTNARFTFYDVGLWVYSLGAIMHRADRVIFHRGACGQTNVPSDFVSNCVIDAYVHRPNNRTLFRSSR